ncbi:MAG: hypothetical protein ACI4AI_01525 [Paludibacteraceae bacterium]
MNYPNFGSRKCTFSLKLLHISEKSSIFAAELHTCHNRENETNWYKSDPVHMVGTTPIVNKGRATMPAKAPKKLLPKTLGLNLQ